MDSFDGGWNEWGKHVLLELERLNIASEENKTTLLNLPTKEDLKELTKSIKDVKTDFQKFKDEEYSETKTEVGRLGVKAGVWGALSGLIATIGALLLFYKKGGG